MEKDPNYLQDAAKAVAGDRLGTEGTEAQVRPGDTRGDRDRGGCPQG